MDVSEIVQSVDIADYIGQYTTLTEENNGELWGLSPLKKEETPSFSVDTSKQLFYDFSTGEGGDIISFIRKYYNCDFKTAMSKLQEYAGVSDVNVRKSKLKITQIAKQYQPKKQEKKTTYSILPADYMENFKFDKEKLKVWMDEDIQIPALKKYQVRYDSFSNRIMYPIRNINGDIINISGRTLDPDFKEKKIRKYTYLKPLGVLDTIYGVSDNIDYIKRKNEIILFEGAKSVMKADGWGVKNCGAILTSHLNTAQLKILVKLGVTVVFALDSDVDITTDRNISRLKRFVKVEWVKNRNKILEDKMAPVDVGFENWKILYERRERLV